MNNTSPAMAAWKQFERLPAGKRLFSYFLCWKAPYFGSIRPRFIALRPEYCEVAVKKRRKIQNHIGTVHAIAMCNMAELAGGTMTDVTIPSTHRWIPKGMNSPKQQLTYGQSQNLMTYLSLKRQWIFQ